MDTVNHLFCVIVMCLIRVEKCSKSRSFIYLVKFILKFVLLLRKKTFYKVFFFSTNHHIQGSFPKQYVLDSAILPLATHLYA